MHAEYAQSALVGVVNSRVGEWIGLNADSKASALSPCLLGKGQRSSVYRVRWAEGAAEYALKLFARRENFDAELKALS